MKALLFLMLLAAGTAAVTGRPPNIILFVADDLGFETLRCYGGTSHPTPHLDRLAADGMRFDSCVATPMCATSRAMLLSGRYNSRNYDTWAYLDPAEATLATRLREAGYVTGMAGKWHLGNWEPDATGSRGPGRMGFDHYLSCIVDQENLKSRKSPGAGNAYWKTALIRNDRREAPRAGLHSEQAYLDFTRDFLRTHRDRPFFLHYASYLAHRPFVKVAHPGPADFNEHGRTANFPAMITRLDAIVGELRAELDTLGLTKDTLFLFTSDNGTDNVREAAGLRSQWRGKAVGGGKYHADELGTTVPFLAAWPGSVKAGGSTRAPLDFTDFLPTLLELAGKPATGSDGTSFLPWLRGTPHPEPRRVAFTWGTLDGSNRVYHDPVRHRAAILHAARDERWRYFSDGRLFDIVADPLMRASVPPGATPEADLARSRLKEALGRHRSTTSIHW
jgi:arylsulfatase A